MWDVTHPAAPQPLGQPLTGHTDVVHALAFAPDGGTLASVGGLDGTIRLWDVTDPASARSPGPVLTGHTNAVHTVAYSPDGRTLATGSFDHTFRLWKVG